MRKPFLVLPLLALLAACGTPRERCVGAANSELRTLDRLIAVTRGNLERGYALQEVQDVRVIRTTCTGTNEDDTTFTFPCDETQTYTRDVPVAIDLNAERAKLQSLQDRRVREADLAATRIEQCIAAYPE
ncbi:MAG: hypothetical protein HLUCCA08_01240 [Rhodobacteraceae bacterium HLUCCA08]|nr:MAG: hypothetical protein HLUCCA08_01240 [Rhodobacteraceae bacterium HLUCCA08]